MRNKNILLLIFALAIRFSPATLAAVDYGVGTGGADCREVSRAIIDEWFTLKNLMSADPKSMKRPRSRDFQCVSPYYVRNLLPKGALGQQKLTCFSLESGAGICCDKRLQSCATLSR